MKFENKGIELIDILAFFWKLMVAFNNFLII